jgi:hypothetical protein
MAHFAMPLAFVATFVAAGVLAAQSPKQKPSERRTREVYVSILDRDGKPVTGLTAADFTVKEDGTVREVLKAGPATEPMALAVTIDDGEAARPYIQFIRDGMKGFIKKMEGKAEIALSTFGDRPTPITEYTQSMAQLEKGIGTLFARPSAGAQLLEAIVDLSRGIERREEPRKAIAVLLVDRGIEFGNLYSATVLDRLKQSGATLHVLAIGQPSDSLEDEMRNRNAVIADGTSLTGGRRDQVLAESGIPERLLRLADELTNQYVVSYSRPETLIPPEKLDVSVSKRGLTVRAPKRTTGR